MEGFVIRQEFVYLIKKNAANISPQRYCLQPVGVIDERSEAATVLARAWPSE